MNKEQILERLEQDYIIYVKLIDQCESGKVKDTYDYIAQYIWIIYHQITGLGVRKKMIGEVE